MKKRAFLLSRLNFVVILSVLLIPNIGLWAATPITIALIGFGESQSAAITVELDENTTLENFNKEVSTAIGAKAQSESVDLNNLKIKLSYRFQHGTKEIPFTDNNFSIIRDAICEPNQEKNLFIFQAHLKEPGKKAATAEKPGLGPSQAGYEAQQQKLKENEAAAKKTIEKFIIRRKWRKVTKQLLEKAKEGLQKMKADEASVAVGPTSDEMLNLGGRLVKKVVADRLNGYADIAQLLFKAFSSEPAVGEGEQSKPNSALQKISKQFMDQLTKDPKLQELGGSGIKKDFVLAMKEMVKSTGTQGSLEGFLQKQLLLTDDDVALLKSGATSAKDEVLRIKDKYWNKATGTEKATYVAAGITAIAVATIAVRRAIKWWSSVTRVGERELNKAIHDLEEIHNNKKLSQEDIDAQEQALLSRYSEANQKIIKRVFNEVALAKQAAIHQALANSKME